MAGAGQQRKERRPTQRLRLLHALLGANIPSYHGNGSNDRLSGKGSHPTTSRVSNTAILVRLPLEACARARSLSALTITGRCQGLVATKTQATSTPCKLQPARSVNRHGPRAVRLLAPGATVEAASRLKLICRIRHVMHVLYFLYDSDARVHSFFLGVKRPSQATFFIIIQ